MISYRIEFHADIAEDYNEAYQWYESKVTGLGEKFLQLIRDKIELIAITPETYGQKHKKGYRECNIDVFPFTIVYKVYKKERKIFVSSVHHYSKSPTKKYRK